MSDENENPDNLSEAELEALTEFDAGDPVAVKRRERKVTREQRESDQFWEYVFNLEVGRRELYRLLRDCHAFEDRFACGPNGFPQPEATWFQAGESALGRRLFQTWMVRHTNAVALMLRENDPRFQKSKK